MQLHLDAIGGVAGDMFIAAMLDAFPDLRDGMLEAIRLAGLPEDIVCRLVEHSDGVLTGARFLVQEPSYRPHNRGLAFPQEKHEHTSFREVRRRLRSSALAPGVKQRAIQIFALLAEVEGKVHGMPAEEVSFHELGGWDSIADMVGAAFVIDALHATHWTVSALPQASGRVKTDHGWLPVPTPATARLLQGFEFIDDGVQGERITPTGAAILRHLNAAQHDVAQQRRPRRLLCSGHGFGTKTFPGLPNVLRVLVFEEDIEQRTQAPGTDRIAQIAFEVDDQTPEDLAIALDRLRAHRSVRDVMHLPGFGKKGRVTAHIQVLADAEDLENVIQSCFDETATLGLRWQLMERRVLARTSVSVDVGGRNVRVKVADRQGSITAKAESDDLVSVQGGRREREAVRQAAEAACLTKERK